ncbi:putative phosphoribosylaminoimidazole-succinocarboxamide synthase protein [Rosellinia necatrix]|uniref:Putative phosphoribosylaminoimidazole-succinocarboxamide synthase protein n=1 Tax=Rosellinia necatrix TaxID=77044 RepID=A0A1W2TIT1_ROSNE|nr:putative phosphoribosylaminoimidazole-succinocarboxamide synthase protein [Rosellinia necatrix]
MSLGYDHVEPNQDGRNYSYNTATDQPQPTGSQATIVYNPQPSPDPRERQPGPPASSSSMSSKPYAPTPPEAPTYNSYPSEEEVYGPERYGGHDANFPEYAASTPRRTPSAPFNPAPFMMGGMQTDALVHRDFKDELTRAAGTVTPGVSDVPYIRYAIDALTRQQREEAENVYGNSAYSSIAAHQPPLGVYRPPVTARQPPIAARQPPVVVHGEDESVSEEWESPLKPLPARFPTPFITPLPTPAVEEQAPFDEEQQPARPRERTRLDEISDNFQRAKTLVEQGAAPAPASDHNPPRTVDVWRAQSDPFSRYDLEAIGYRGSTPPPLTHKPWILRPLSLALLGALCVLVIAAIILSAVYSVGRDGFTAYAGTIYGGQYFLFRVLPQLVGVFLFMYAQCVVAAVFRVFPLSAMASDDRRERRNAVFLPLYQRSFLWPQLFGPWHVWVPTLVVWLTSFTIPLLSSLYTVVLVDDVWTWSTVQGVAWTLVAIYLSLLASVVIVFVHWRHRRTGMAKAWDVRSIADIIFLLSQSNSLPQYRGLETAATRGSMEKVLDGTAERLGYWTTPEAPENAVFWSFGVPTTEEDIALEKWDKNNWAARRDGSRPVTLSDVEDQKEPWAVRHRYLPWCLRDGPLVSSVVAGTALLVALLVVSFLPATDIREGFVPHLTAAPLPGAFSPADFLYSFLPSLLGLALFLGLQTLELTLRVLAPWGELARPEGSRAETSLLLDYAACLPWQATLKAARLRHWRVALVTFLAPLSALLPVLGGGLFMALTPPSGVVRVYPNIAIFGVLLALLFLCLGALASLAPGRARLRLPHAVTCLAEVMSFCCNEQLRTDDAFDLHHHHHHYHQAGRTIVRRRDLEQALDCGLDKHRQGRWTFGAGMDNEERIGIKRHSRLTVNAAKAHHYDKHVRGKPISAPLLHGSGPLFNGQYS